MPHRTPEDFIDKIRADVGEGLLRIFDSEIESLAETGPEKRVREILEGVRDRLLAESRLPKDR